MWSEFPKLIFRGKGHEVTFPFFNNSFSSKLQASDLKYLLKQYELWANRVYPKYTFKDFIRGEIKLSFFFSSLPSSISFPLSLGLWEKHVEPFQLENGRLTQENIALHQQIMTLKESLEQRTKDLKASMRHLEHENADLKFLNNQYMQRLIAQEKESHAKSEQILELQEKNSQPVIVQTPSGRKRTLPYRCQ